MENENQLHKQWNFITDLFFSFLDSGPHYSLAKVHEGGQLIINNVEPSRDQGTYTCIVRSRAGEEARREVQLNVNSK